MLAIDVHYGERGAIAAAVAFSAWDTNFANDSYTSVIHEVQAYRPGEFYQRELPCILSVLEKIPQDISCIVIDGYVTLGAAQRPGLGSHLWEALQRSVPIIGVAKTRFFDTPHSAELLRGESKRPLYISSVGIALPEAKQNILKMHGPYRIPTLLTLVDNLAKGLREPRNKCIGPSDAPL